MYPTFKPGYSSILPESKEIRLELFDCTDGDQQSESEYAQSSFKRRQSSVLYSIDGASVDDDDSKIIYNQIGFITISIEDALKHLVRKGRGPYDFTKNIYQDNDDADYFGLDTGKPAAIAGASSQGTSNEKFQKAFKKTSASLNLQANLKLGQDFLARLGKI